MYLENLKNQNNFLPMADKVKTNGEMVSTTAAAEILGVSTARVRKMILDGFFEGVQYFGTNRAIPLAEVERVKKEREKMQKDESGNLVGGRPPKPKSN